MRIGLQQTAAPAVEPISPTTAKLHLRVDISTDDNLITSAIVAARKYAEARTQRQLITATWKLYLDEFPAEILLPRPPIGSVSTLKYLSTAGVLTTLDSANYLVSTAREPATIRPAYGKSWPSTRTQMEAVQVTYTAGYGAAATNVPEGIIQAILLLVAHMYEFRQPVLTGTIVNRIPLAVDALLSQYKTGWGW